MAAFSPRHFLRLALALLPVLGAAFGALPQRAHAGPVEVLDGMLLQPSNPKLITLSYDQGFGGLLVSRDGGHTFQLRNALSFTQFGIRSSPALGYTLDDTLYVGDDEGLFHDDGKGCHFTQDTTVGSSPVQAIVSHPSDRSVAFILTAADGTTRGGLWQRDATGVLSAIGSDDPATFVAHGLAVVPRAASTEGLRFFEVGTSMPSASDDAGVGTNSQLFRTSDDLGMTWATTNVMPNDGDIRLLGVDPTDLDRVVIGLSREGLPDPPDSVLVSTDGGATFTDYIDGVAELGQSVVAADGRFWLAGTSGVATGGGLWFASRIGEPPQQLLTTSTFCVGHDDASDTLYVCERAEFGQLDANNHYCRMTQFTEVSGFPVCAGENLIGQQATHDQLCNAYCGAAHYASAPLCGLYNSTSPVACGLPARAFDDMNYGWPASGPPDDGTPRCAGFALASTASDAGVALVDAGSSSLSGSLDAGTQIDAQVPPESVAKPDSGCSVGSATGRAANAWAGSLILTLATVLVGRRRRGARVSSLRKSASPDQRHETEGVREVHGMDRESTTRALSMTRAGPRMKPVGARHEHGDVRLRHAAGVTQERVTVRVDLGRGRVRVAARDQPRAARTSCTRRQQLPSGAP